MQEEVKGMQEEVEGMWEVQNTRGYWTKEQGKCLFNYNFIYDNMYQTYS